MMPWQWLRDLYPIIPQEQKQYLGECTVEAGEYIYVPEGYYHQTLNLEPGMFIIYGEKGGRFIETLPNTNLPTKELMSKQCSQSTGDENERIDHCRLAIKQFPLEPQFNYILGKLLYSNRWSSNSIEDEVVRETINVLVQGLRKNPMDANLLSTLTSVLYSASQCYDVIALFQHLYSINMDDLHSTYLHARCFYLHEYAHPSTLGKGVSKPHDKEKYTEDLNLYVLEHNDTASLDDYLNERLEHLLYSEGEYEPGRRRLPNTEKAKAEQYYAVEGIERLMKKKELIAPGECYEKVRRKKNTDEFLCDKPANGKYKKNGQHTTSHDMLVKVIRHARTIIRRSPLQTSQSEVFFAYADLFFATTVLQAFNFLTEEEIEWLGRPSPVFDSQLYKNENDYALRYFVFISMEGVSERNYNHWVDVFNEMLESDAASRSRHVLNGVASFMSGHPHQKGMLGLTKDDVNEAYTSLSEVFQTGPPLECYDIVTLGAGESNNKAADEEEGNAALLGWERECDMCVMSGCAYCRSLKKCIPISKRTSVCSDTKSTVSLLKSRSSCRRRRPN
eukprot:m.61090 g.61090  ORF g.61090 m.61090 type:complete len:561 (-) comp11377_c0_seq1:98-1780(-)